MNRNTARDLYLSGLRDLQSLPVSVPDSGGDLEIPFDDVFHPLRLILKGPNGHLEHLSSEDLLTAGRSRVWLRASGGSGKSMLLRRYLRKALDAESCGLSRRLPFLLSLEKWSEFVGGKSVKAGDKADELFRSFLQNELGETFSQSLEGVPSAEIEKLIREGERLFLIDGIDEVFSPADRRTFWTCWNRFSLKVSKGLSAVLALRPEGWVSTFGITGYAQVGVQPINEDHGVFEGLCRNWATALDCEGLDDFVEEVESNADTFASANWIRIGAVLWKREKSLPPTRYGLFSRYAHKLLAYEHKLGEAPIERNDRQIVHEIQMLGRVATTLLGRDDAPALSMPIEVAEWCLKEAKDEFRWKEDCVDHQIELWQRQGGLIEFVPPDQGLQQGSLRFERQTLDYLLAIDAGWQLVRFLLVEDGAVWPDILEDESQLRSMEFVPDRVASLLTGESGRHWKQLIQRLPAITRPASSPSGSQDRSAQVLRARVLIIGHILERVLASRGSEEPWKGRKDEVRSLLAASFPLDHAKRLKALKDVPEGIRVRAAESLARLGDPREELLDPTKTTFVPVPGGTCTLSQTKESKELEPFEMARFPVTVAQYRRFLADSKDEGMRPYDWESQEILTAPVNGVNLGQAEAFCRWLSEKTSREIRLPDEFEWEWAANGAHEASGSPSPREYPWDDRPPDSFLANFGNRLERVSPVGCYPAGASLQGDKAIEDLAGNVWEWTSSAWDPAQKDEHERRRVLRGS